MTKVKILGAGSIGNHLSNAARAKGWDITLCDIDPAALERTRNDIYPSRYGKFDDAINLCLNDEAPKGGFDYIFIGTPPDSHIKLALEAVKEKPKAILVEKPMATPDLKGCQELYKACEKEGIKCFVGYDHAVAHSTDKFADLAKNLKDIKTLDVFFREHWQGIFNAHPWLNGPADTYLGYWQRGGGALGEHSHAVHLWLYIASVVGAGRVKEVTASLEYIQDGEAEFDRLALLNVKTESGLIGSIVQDVVTKPTQKSMRLQGVDKALEWQCVPSPYQDIVRQIGEQSSEEIFEKKRPDDFITELNHIENILENGSSSPISIEMGLDAMMVIAAAHLSSQEGQKVLIDYTKGYVPEALSLAGSKNTTAKAA
ncbi:MAG: Gfo/Idh/MocA family oxidoreductase [Micavibrio sp.]|nr:Gfo/Idh/MocA family oxidoreductase [Micavibrio sp.]